jgi:hypothetical protein
VRRRQDWTTPDVIAIAIASIGQAAAYFGAFINAIVGIDGSTATMTAKPAQITNDWRHVSLLWLLEARWLLRCATRPPPQ